MFYLEDSDLDFLKKRYSHIHPLMLHRSIERASNMSNLFDILEGVPDKYPIAWDEALKSWVSPEDTLLSK